MEKRELLFWNVILIFCFIGPSLFIVNVKAETVQRQYILSSDVIRNFKFDSFNGIPVSTGGGVYDNKLKFEISTTWKIYKDDVSLIYMQQIGDKVQFRYQIQMRNSMNIVTNVKLTQAAQILSPLTSAPFVVMYRHFDCWNNERWNDRVSRQLEFRYWQFGNIRTWNGQHNSFSGDLKMSFDIDDTPMPVAMRDPYGNTFTKELEYIAVSSASVINSTYGRLSDDKPIINVITPEEYDYQSNTVGAMAGDNQDIQNVPDNTGITLTFRVNPRLSTPFLANTFDEGIAPMSSGASLNPTDKNGDPIWNPLTEHKSMTNASLTYNLGRLGPIVEEYYSTLTYTSFFYNLIDACFFWVDPTRQESRSQESTTQPVALHVKNRYIQPNIAVVFDVVSEYAIDIVSSPFGAGLQAPVEYYDELVWSAVVDGFGGGDLYYDYDTPLDALWRLLAPILILAVIIIATIIAVKLLRKTGSKDSKVVIYNVKESEKN